MGAVGVQGDRSVNHQWLRFILPPLSKPFKGGFVYLLRRQELGIWGTGNQGFHSPSPPLLPHTSPIPLPPNTHRIQPLLGPLLYANSAL